MVENVIQIKSGLTMKVDVDVKFQINIMCARTIIFGILRHVFAQIVNM